ncbi:lysophospholipid acyltransferase family protein [Paracoccus sanguinis]|uniref:1-acyl-sn-glycerol-3-phosphate acyltransferase n=1 Tax=Paracoccus sanguinis TaxID=1545044 RepID=A0A1H2TA13_9RHOB|nr:lysophospholipid acyltransferase family protein [Paracoccus sanguinis]SDW40114.1 1-acyl-sn-glycerol-3-phosphate acyltransferase [Paracoccus sanguinis]
MARRVEIPGWALDHGPAADPAAYRPGPLPALWRVRTTVYYLWIAGVTLVMGLWWLPKVMRDPRNAHVLPVVWTGRLLAAARTILGVSVELRGTPPTTDAIIAAKHQSFLDILAISHAVPQCGFIMKREVMRVPVMGYYARRAGCIPIDRARGGEAMRQITGEIAERMAGPEGLGQLIIYPEGTRTRPGERRRYKHGVGTVQAATGLNVHPVAVNCGMFWPREGLRIRPGRSVIEFLPPVPPEADPPETVARLEALIEGRSDALMAMAGLALPGADAPRA